MVAENELHVPWWKSKLGGVLLAFLGIGGYFLFTEHLAHTVQALPYLLLLCCIVMVVYMSRIHRGENIDRNEAGIKSNGENHGR